MRYLLGDLSEDEKTRMEEAFIADESKFEAMELAEAELIDAYVRDELSAEPRQQLKNRLLQSPKLADRVNFATLLAEKADAYESLNSAAYESSTLVSHPAGQTKSRWWNALFTPQPGWGLAAAACVVIILAGSFLIAGWLRLRNEANRLQAERLAVQQQKEELDRKTAEQQARDDQQTVPQQSDQKPEDPKVVNRRTDPNKNLSNEPSIVASIVPISLYPSSSSRGGGGGSDLRLGPNVTVEANLFLERNDYRSYHVTVEGSSRKLRFRNLSPKALDSATALTFRIPAKQLEPGDYIVTVNGVNPSGESEAAGYYSFRVLRQK